jgi:hypothetical protein
MISHNGIGISKGFILSISRLLNNVHYKNVSSNNRLVTSYIYGLDQTLSPYNRIIGAEVYVNHQSQEGKDEKEKTTSKAI